jgi:flavin-dependent dehydrogenase
VIDLLVAGGGPVGLAVAIRGRLAGLHVTVVEPRSTPVDKACGEGLMPSAVRGLRDLGVEVDGRPFTGIGYVAGHRRVEARFADGPGLGVRRTTLHAALAARADDVGVERMTGRIDQVSQFREHIEAAGTAASWLVAADGLHSSVRRAIGLDRATRGPARFGLRRHFQVEPWTDLVEVHWSEHAEAYVTPVGAELVGVALLCNTEGHRRGYAETLADFPDLRARLGGVEPVTTVRGAGPLRQVARSPSHGRVLLVGDAAGYVDALTGEGLATGLATAAAAVQALLDGRPEAYDARWRAATRRYRWITLSLVAAANRPQIRRAIVPAAVRLPWVFSRLVNALG